MSHGSNTRGCRCTTTSTWHFNRSSDSRFTLRNSNFLRMLAAQSPRQVPPPLHRLGRTETPIWVRPERRPSELSGSVRGEYVVSFVVLYRDSGSVLGTYDDREHAVSAAVTVAM